MEGFDMSNDIYEAVKQDFTAKYADDDLLHAMCTEINNAFDNFDFGCYEDLLDIFTNDIDERNWLEDLCTDIRHLLDWSKC